MDFLVLPLLCSMPFCMLQVEERTFTSLTVNAPFEPEFAVG